MNNSRQNTHRLFGLVLSLICVSTLCLTGCFDPTSDKVDAGGGAAKKVAEAETTANDIEFQLTGDNTFIKWTGSNSVGLSPYGYFYELDGVAIIDGDTKRLKFIEFTIDMTACKASAPALTEKLLHKGFFEVERFPESKFVITSVSDDSRDGDPAGTNTVIEGNFQLRDVTKSITFPAEVTFNEVSAKSGDSVQLILASEFKLNRKDYGVVHQNSTEDALIRDDILLNIDIDITTKIVK